MPEDVGKLTFYQIKMMLSGSGPQKVPIHKLRSMIAGGGVPGGNKKK